MKNSVIDSPPAPSAPTRPSSRVPRWLRVLIPAVLIAIWFALFGLGGSSFGSISDVSTNGQAQFLPASSEATKVNELQAAFRSEDTVPAIVVYASENTLTDTDKQAIAANVEAIGSLDGVVTEGISPVIFSEDGKAAEIFVPIDSAAETADVVSAVRDVIAENTAQGLTAAVTGPAGLSADLVGAFAGIDGLLLMVALAAVFLILVVVYRSPLLPLIMLGSSMAALCAAVFTVVALARADILLLSGQTQGILFILVIGAATDYSLLYIARYREALHEHASKWSATWAALRGSWEPILASGGTVIAALMILLFSDLNSNKMLGPVAAIGIVFALLAALTLLPALMLWAGRAAFWPRRPQLGDTNVSDLTADSRGLWPAVARLVRRRPRVIWIGSTLLLVVMALGMTQLKADGVPASEFVLGESQARDGQAVLAEHFPGGSGTPAVVIAPEAALNDVADVLLKTDGVASVSVLSEDSPSGSLPVTSEGIQAVGPPGTPVGNPTVVDGTVLLQATLDDAPDSLEAEAVVADLRTSLEPLSTEAAPVLVGGVTAIALDTNSAAIHDRNLIIPLVLLVILLILMLLLRAVVAPLLLIGSVVLSFAAALGVSALVFNGVFGFAGADPTVPLFGFIFLVALGVDYNIFLMSRVREETVRHGAREGMLRGLIVTGGVITSAGLVLAATFAALGVLPILFLAQLAFIVAFGVLLDTFLVRSLLIPALGYDLGRAIWWPSKLSRVQDTARYETTAK